MHFEIPCNHGVGTVVEAAVRESVCLGNVTIYQDLGQMVISAMPSWASG